MPKTLYKPFHTLCCWDEIKIKDVEDETEQNSASVSRF